MDGYTILAGVLIFFVLFILLYNQAKINPAIPKSTKPYSAPIKLPNGVKL